MENGERSSIPSDQEGMDYSHAYLDTLALAWELFQVMRRRSFFTSDTKLREPPQIVSWWVHEYDVGQIVSRLP